MLKQRHSQVLKWFIVVKVFKMLVVKVMFLNVNSGCVL